MRAHTHADHDAAPAPATRRAPAAPAPDTQVAPPTGAVGDHDRLAASPESVEELQRQAGNRAVALAVQRKPLDTEAPETPLGQIDEMLDRWNTPEDEVITLLGQLKGGEKATVIAGYRDRLARALDFGEMKRAVVALGADLATKLDWLEKATLFGAGFIDYGEISDLVAAAPRTERDALKNARWKAFFTTVCTGGTMVQALGHLDFDVVTHLDWLRSEPIVVGVKLSDVKGVLAKATPAELAIVGGDDWTGFWTQVCTKADIAEAAATLYPGNLTRQVRLADLEDPGIGQTTWATTLLQGFTPAERLAVFGDAAAVTLIRSFMPTGQAAVVQALGGTVAQQLTLLGPAYPVEEITWAHPTAEWVDALVAQRPTPIDVLRVAGTDMAWAGEIRGKYAAAFRGKTDTVHGEGPVAMAWAAYGDGAAFSAADTMVVFRSLFGVDVTPAGNVLFPNGANKRQRYRAIAPDDATARELMKMVKTIPRSQVAAAPIAFCDLAFDETLDAFGAWQPAGTATFDTSFYWQGKIIIKVDSAGHGDETAIGIAGREATAYGGEGTQGPGGPLTAATALTYFQNHVRHEIGHAVGEKTIGHMTTTGNDFFLKWAGWKDATAADFTAAMWAPIAQPLAGWPQIDFGSGPVAVSDADVRTWMVNLLANGAETPGPVGSGAMTPRQKIDVIAGSMWGSQNLTKYLSTVGGASPAAIRDSAYQFPGYEPTTPVHIFSTREGNKFKTYDKAAHDALHGTTGWYSLSSHKEMFAEIYTRKYSGGGAPGALNGMDPVAFFAELEKQEDPMFGAPATTPAAPTPGAPTP